MYQPHTCPDIIIFPVIVYGHHMLICLTTRVRALQVAPCAGRALGSHVRIRRVYKGGAGALYMEGEAASSSHIPFSALSGKSLLHCVLAYYSSLCSAISYVLTIYSGYKVTTVCVIIDLQRPMRSLYTADTM